MTVEIYEPKDFREISVVGLNAYLASQGWERQETWQDRIVVWTNERNEHRREVLTPVAEHTRAYLTRITETLAELAAFEERSQFDVYRDVIATRADVVRFRSANGFESREWSLPDGVDLLSTSRDLMAAAARSAENPGQPVYRYRPSGAVNDYLRDVRPVFGTQKWHDFAIHSPVPADYGIRGDLGDDYAPPFSRKVMLALYRGLSEARGASDKVLGGAEIPKTFGSATERGLNANLCEALAGLTERAHGVSVGLTWASVRPKETTFEEFAFGVSSIDIFRESAKWFRGVNPFFNAHVEGEVVILRREEDRLFDGQAVVVSELDSKPVSLYVQFAEPDHETVTRAFHEGIPISLNGDIHREGRKYRLKSLTDVRLVEPGS